MKVSKSVALNYVTQDNYFFPTRADRNNAFSGDDVVSGTTVAVAENESVDMNNTTDALWNIEKFNGANWTLETLDGNYSLTVTNEGLAALAAIKEGQYVFDISCVKVKANNITNPSTPLTNWTDANFTAEGDIVLNTAWGDESFSVNNNKTLKWRNSLGNAGMQLTLMVDSDTYGYQSSGGTRTRLEDYTIGAIGLYVKDQRDTAHEGNLEGVLFAVGNLQAPIQKYTTNATRVGNSIKLYFNLAISNLGHIANITSTPEDFHSLPEVASESQLDPQTPSTTFPATAYPYNVYLVDNYLGSNAPALALRTLGEVTIDEYGIDRYNWRWTYLTPQDDTITIKKEDFDTNCKNYMAVSWDPVSGKFVPADGDRYIDANSDQHAVTSILTGIKVGNTIIFAGNMSNHSYNYLYSADLHPLYRGQDYKTGDILYKIIQGRQFFVSVSNVNDADMRIEAISEISPSGGDTDLGTTGYDYWTCARRGDAPGGTYDMSKVARIKFSTTNVLDENYCWNFPDEWLNKPLYADIGENAGKFTIRETECFIGWCTRTGRGTSQIKLALDLRNEATYTDYGTTRYATYSEVNKVSSGTREITSVCPKELKENFFQIRIPGSPEQQESSDGESYEEGKWNKNAGISASNPIVVDTYTKFTKPIVSAVPTGSVGFQGTAYRALWEDLAEYYEADRNYPAGTLITIGSGEKEITIATNECNGVISDKPGYELGDKLTANHLPVALVGKVPVMFDNKCVPHFGDRVYLSRYEDGKASTETNGFCLGKIIDKRPSLEEHKNNILCSIRISF